MRNIISLIILAMLLVLIGCNSELLREGELLYKNSEELIGAGDKISSNQDKVLYVINENNIKKLQEELRGISDLTLKDQVAIYVSLGEQPTGGYNIKIKEIRKRDKKLIVIIKAIAPKEGTPVTQAITYPYDIVKLFKEDLKQIEEIVFLSTEGKNILEKNL